ncbi:uncharacterized protein FA14DRAFT_160742 [Meira miltonrushii]|uniref:Clathrin light chain n=1 Tax=Meira miltonrushii TaxID=1280837 RepID=A0A316VF72_9BASI|nr:uncharacterized protein FA14DRAFT_160742 [Meira miltonrushii]PWN35708.1 hypothetical protein FA14DRAFT_160742 [Meira miltonrushii]
MSFDFGERQESDPTADFLARERAAAGALSGEADLFGGSTGQTGGNSLSSLQGQSVPSGNHDFETSASNFPALDGEDDGFGAPTSTTNAAPNAGFDGDDLLGGGGGAPAAPVDSERDQFEKQFPELDDDIPSEPHPAAHASTNGFMAPNVGSNIGSGAQENSYRAPSVAPGVPADPYGLHGDDEEPEAVRRWREEQEEDIARREAAAERRKGETISKAEQDIDNYYAEYNKKKEKSIAKNKEAEAAFKAQRQAELAEGTTWSRVTKLVDLQNSQSKTIARGGPGSSDLTRMKEILLSLRREGETAPGASGY